MNQTFMSVNNGLLHDGEVHTVAELVAALSTEQQQNLLGFTRYRLRAVTRSQHLQRCLAAIDAEDLIAEALLKLQLGEQEPSLGRRLRPENLTSTERFLACVRGVINSDLNHLVATALNQPQAQRLGDPEADPETVDPASTEDPIALLLRRDLLRALFTKLHRRIAQQPALLEVVQDWEQNFTADRIGDRDHDPNLVHRVRLIVREILDELAHEAGLTHGREMLL